MKYLKVRDKYRKNPLSKTPGGRTVVITYRDRVLSYPNIKNVSAYIKAILFGEKGDSILRIEVGDDVLYEKNKNKN